MPRRVPTSATRGRASSNVSFADVPPMAIHADNLSLLRRQWKWANFSQFFFTFAQLLAVPDITLTDIEDDLSRGTALYIPRVMHRLLYTLTQDRKISLETWQSALRKQYLRRNPDANPLGPEPPTPSRMQSHDSATPMEDKDEDDDAPKQEQGSEAVGPSHSINDKDDVAQNADILLGQPQSEEARPVSPASPKASVKELSASKPDPETISEEAESRNWLDLSMLEKLDSLHLLTEWQFQSPHRLRSLMKDDGDHGLWRIEPVGYDAKQNAYWLIGPDRLWIQRKPPRPPASLKRKRKAPPAKTTNKASTSKAVAQQVSDSEPEVAPQKRTRASNGRALRSKRGTSPATPSGRSARAAKLQANKKLDAQARELAEFQRQAALTATSEKSSPRSTRHTRNNVNASDNSGRKNAVGTRTSARLRGESQDGDDDEWQQIPDEWLKETMDPATPNRTRSSARKAKPRGRQPLPPPSEDDEDEDETVQDGPHTGLSSDDAISELTELSDDEQLEPTKSGPVKSEAGDVPLPTPPGDTVVEATALKKEPKEEKADVAPDIFAVDVSSHIPADFVEWEAICITLQEWESIPERFAKATHYLEKALYKVLTQSIVPAVTEDLREAERKRKLEEAIVHRKRSSRIALREVEKEEARIAAAKKAEEEEKLARTRRVEARIKKDDEGRGKREQAREQRRLEREERERRAQERKDGTAVPTPSASVVSSSAHPTRNPTPNGIRTPDWTLDCEVCGRCGVNMDDGLPMVSCGMCSRWQHITCHDTADRNAGVPRRNWEVQQFYCSRCKPAAMQRLANGGSRTSVTERQRSQSRTPKTHTPEVGQYNSYPQPPADTRYSPHQVPYANGMSYGQQYPQDQLAVNPASMYTRSQRPQGGITFSHYQPQQHGFSRSTWSNGYPTESYNGRAMPQYGHQYHQNGSYSSSQPAYQYPSSSAVAMQSYSRGQPQDIPQRMMDAVPPMHNQSWMGPADGHHASPSGQINPSHYSAAESLAFMQGSTSTQPAWANGSYPQHSGTTIPPTSQPSPASHHSPMGNGGYHYPQS